MEAARVPPLRIGLIVDGSNVSKYTYELAAWARNQENLRVEALIIQKVPRSSRWSRFGRIVQSMDFRRLVQAFLLSVILPVERQLLRRSHHKNHLSTFDVSELVKNSVLVTPVVSPSGFVFRYGEDDLAKIEALNLDVLIRCGSGILRGAILRAVPFGIISFHHGDNRVNRGGPPGFWEVFLRQDASGFTIQQLTEELDGGRALFRGCINTKRWWLLNQASVYKVSAHYMRVLLSQLAVTRELPELEDNRLYSAPLYRSPSASALLRYGAYLLGSIFRVATDRIARRQFRWGVAFLRHDWQRLPMWRAHQIENPSNHFLADPFLISHEGHDYCFVEDFDYETRKGTIATYRLDEDCATRLGTALEEPFHLSFPYLLHHQGALYMCPEAAASKEIRLYRCTEFPLKWEKAHVLMANVSAADTMLVQRDGLWWMFTNLASAGDGDHCSELSVFYASDLFDAKWLPHPRNPIWVDSTRARNAGLLSDSAGTLYRVAQRQGFDQYGKGFTINRITKLSTLEYEEETWAEAAPTFFDGLKGTHHLHSNGEVSAFDYLRAGNVRT